MGSHQASHNRKGTRLKDTQRAIKKVDPLVTHQATKGTNDITTVLQLYAVKTKLSTK